MEAINLSRQLQPNPGRPLPDNFRDRADHILPTNQSKIHQQIQNINKYAETNQMKLNLEKTKLMIFNTSKNKDFRPCFKINNTTLDIEEETKLLGVHFTRDLKWQKHVDESTKKAYRNIWILKRLSQLGASRQTLRDTYCKQVRSQLEYCVPIWHPALTEAQTEEVERVQSASLRVILGEKYKSARSARDHVTYRI